MNFNNIFVTGGAGYVGAVLVPALLNEGYRVTVLDLMLYGADALTKHPMLNIIKGDVRNQQLLEKSLPGHDAVIHLACISNDPSFELNPRLGKSINLDAFRPLVEIAEKSGVKRFVYASSSSVYGVKSESNVHEEMALEPLTDYSRFKAMCEDILLSRQTKNFHGVVIRPATVCGYSKRQRLDVVVNLLTNLAYHNREITIFGGDQLRPNIHITDMVEAYRLVLASSSAKVAGRIFNAGFENQTVNDIALTVRDIVGSDVSLVRQPTDDNRSYHISSSRIERELSFRAKHTISDAVRDLLSAFENELLPGAPDHDRYFNIKTMQQKNLS
jgi:nucleoside-diphosphate-sugar epimerase